MEFCNVVRRWYGVWKDGNKTIQSLAKWQADITDFDKEMVQSWYMRNGIYFGKETVQSLARNISCSSKQFFCFYNHPLPNSYCFNALKIVMTCQTCFWLIIIHNNQSIPEWLILQLQGFHSLFLIQATHALLTSYTYGHNTLHAKVSPC